MDRLPNDVIARVFSHLPILDLGIIMSVTRSWNTLLSTSPKLWIKVNLSEWPRELSTSKVLQIVQVFSNRSQSTLETVMLPHSTSVKPLEIAKMMQVMEPSKGTLRKLAFWPSGYDQPSTDLMDFVSRCPQLEELDLTGNDRGCEQVETSPGVLTHFSCYHLDIVPENWIDPLRNLKVLQVMESAGPLLLKVLSNCSATLQHFTLSGGTFSESMQEEIQELVSRSLYQLRVLRIEESDNPWSREWDLSALENLEELGINVGHHSMAGHFKNQIKLHLLLPCYYEDGGEDLRLEWLQSLIDVVESHQGSLQVLSLINLSGAEIINYSVDQFLNFLRVNIVLGAPCPNLKELHLPKDLEFSATLLAEVLLSRRLLSKGYSILSPEGSQDAVHSCSKLVLFLDSENQEGFKEAEREVLSKCSEKMREAAGETILRTRL